MNNLVMQDVCEVYLKDAVSGNAYFFGITTKNEVTQKIKQEFLKGGIGNGVVGVVQSEKDLSFKVTTLLNNDDLIAIQSGKAFASNTYTVQKSEVLKCATSKLTLVGTPKATTTPVVFDSFGKPQTGTFTTNQFTITSTPVEGAFYTVVYQQDVTGNILSLDSKSFPTTYYVELHTIGYNVDTNAVACDVYWTFNKALPNGSLAEAYEAGKNSGNDIEFTALLPAGTTEYGKYIVIPRP